MDHQKISLGQLLVPPVSRSLGILQREIIIQNGYIVQYRVTITETETNTVSRSNVTGTSLTVTSLHPYYVYMFSVAAVTVGIGPYSDGVNVTTDEDGKLIENFK